MTLFEKKEKTRYVFHDNQTLNTILPSLAVDVYRPRVPGE